MPESSDKSWLYGVLALGAPMLMGAGYGDTGEDFCESFEAPAGMVVVDKH